MAEVSILTAVKAAVGLQGNDNFDTALENCIEDVKQYLLDGGCSEEIVEMKSSAGVIVRGATDLWDHGSCKGSLSSYFKERAIQLCSKAVAKNV